MTNHNSFCTWWCKFSCSIVNKMCEIILPKFLLKLNPVTSVKGDSFNWHSFFAVNNKITPLCTSTAHLTLNLGIVSMGSFQLAHVPNPLTKELGVWAGIKGTHLKLRFWALDFKGIFTVGVYYLSIWRAPQNWRITTNPLLKTCTGVFWLCVFVIPVDRYWLIFNPMSCVSRVECLWAHDFLSKFIMTALSVGN